MGRIVSLLIVWLLCALPAAAFAQSVDVDAYIRDSEFNDISISPNGDYLAATIPLEDRTALAILRRSDRKLVNILKFGQQIHVSTFLWVSENRLVFTLAQKMGMLEMPQPTGELLSVEVGQQGSRVLMGWRSAGKTLGSHIGKSGDSDLAVVAISRIPGDGQNVLVTVTPYSERESWTRVDRMNVETGKQTSVARAPVRGARFYADNSGEVRFSTGSEYDNVSKLYYRKSEDSDWRLINDEDVSGVVEVPLGFSKDNLTAYLQVEQRQGPDIVVAYDLATGMRKEVLGDRLANPVELLWSGGDAGDVVGAYYNDAKPHMAYLDQEAPGALTYRMLEAAFPGQVPLITSTTRDGKLAVVMVFSDREPGSFYLFDTQAKRADYLLSRRRWIDQEAMAPMRPVMLSARDGLPMRGYLSVPLGKEAKNLPLIVLPHGGPFTIYDSWMFDSEVQLLVAAGYAVLQVNFRGSGNYGRAFLQAGARQWGLKMQDDLTDATRWAIAEGVADPRRICLFGASYGAYAALMGVVKEPGLYRCAAGYVGVYDLPLLAVSDARLSKRTNKWTSDWIGSDKEQLAATSPDRQAGRIKVPVFLAAGGQDETAPIEHTQKMEAALKAAGVPVESLYYPTEGHGFYTQEHRREFYMRLLKFLDRNIGTANHAAAP